RDEVLPRLADRLDSTAIVSTTIKTIGIGESAAEDMVSEIIHRGNPVVATYAKDDGVHIRITASDADRTIAQKLVDQTDMEIRKLFGPHAYGNLDTRLGAAILAHCQRRGSALTVLEAGSAGRITNLLAEESDLAGWFNGGRVEHFADAASRFSIDTDQDDAPLQVARSLATSDSSAQTSTVMAITARAGELADGERRKGDIAFCLNLNGELHERTHRVEANPSEIRRRAALWASEFLHVSLATSAG
ncbi:MAG: CinA family protein, partial [Thermomicrobiaceae bacterium]